MTRILCTLLFARTLQMITKAYYITLSSLAVKLGYEPNDGRIADATLILYKFFRSHGDDLKRARLLEDKDDLRTAPVRFMLVQPTTRFNFHGGRYDLNAEELVVEKPEYVDDFMKYLEGPAVVECLERCY